MIYRLDEALQHLADANGGRQFPASVLEEVTEELAAYCEGVSELDEVLQRAKAAQQAQRPPLADDEPDAVASHAARMRAVSRYYHLLASRDRSVQEFRSDELGGGLLGGPEAAAAWIKERLRGAKRVSIEVPVDWQPGDPLPEGADTRPHHVFLHFAGVKNAESWQESVTVTGGVLDRLHRLSERLAKDYPWQEAQATTFILTDVVPAVPAGRVWSSSLPTGSDESKIQALFKAIAGARSDLLPERVTVEVDREVPPPTVADLFRRASGGGRVLGENAWLATEFTIARPSRAWADLYRAFERLRPGLYGSDVAFRQAAVKGLKRLGVTKADLAG